MPGQRKLAAIMFTDIAGYSSLMSSDEKKAMAILKKNRDIHKAAIDKHHGQYIKEIGDGTLSIFQSSVDAINCALEIQKACCEDQDFKIRIGIHTGDVIFEENDVFGDGVNIASRIEASGEPGGIYFSEKVYDDIRNQTNLKVKYLGEKNLKNIDHPVRIFTLLNNEQQKHFTKPFKKFNKARYILGISLLVMVSAFLYLYFSGRINIGTGAANSGLEKSIAVLPLSNWSQDKENAYLGDAVADAIILQLSRVHDLRVLSLTSTSRYKEHPRPIAEIAKELGVNYIIEGGIQRHDDNLSIRIQLIRAKNESHLWGEEYNGQWKDIFSFQDMIAKNIASQLQAVLSPEEKDQIEKIPTLNFEAYRLYLKGQQSNILDGITYFKQALDMDSTFALAWAGLAHFYCIQMWYLPPALDKMPDAEAAVLKALELDPNLPEAYYSKGILNLNKWNWEDAEQSYRKAISLNPNISVIHLSLGMVLTYTGRLQEARKELEKAVYLDPLSSGAVNNLGMVNITAHNYDDVIRTSEEALSIFPITKLHTYPGQAYLYKGMYQKALDIFTRQDNQYWMGITYSKMGNREEAMKLLQEIKDKEKTEYVSPFLKSLLLFSLELTDEGFKALEKAYEVHDLELTEINTYPLLDPIKDDPRYLAILKKMGLD